MTVQDMNHMGEKLVICDSLNTVTTFTTETCQKTFKIQCGPLNFDSEKAFYL